MKQPKNVLISYVSSFDDEKKKEIFGYSGIMISKHWVITHGSLINPLMKKNTEIENLLTNLKPGEFFKIPDKLQKEMKFRILWETSKNDNDEVEMEENKGSVMIVWKCPLLKETFDSLFASWKFNKLMDRRDGLLLMPVFLMINLGSEFYHDCSIILAREALNRFVQQDLAYPVRGSIAEIESTPFGNPVFIDSIARGVISNIVGYQNCVALSDANSVPGCEGGPVYVIDDRKQRRICGMVIAPLSWCRGEWVDYTLIANLKVCLSRGVPQQQFCQLLKNRRCLDDVNLRSDNCQLADLLDRCVVPVQCGSSWGTGILIEKKSGTILTCSHVVREAPVSDIKVMLNRDENKKKKPTTTTTKKKNKKEHVSPTRAELVYRTPDNKPYDVAVLRVNPEEMDPSLGSIYIQGTFVSRGDVVATAGFPFFSSSLPTISKGNVSRSLPCMLQTTCCVQSGTSGGPIVCWPSGEMLGMIVCNAISSSNSELYPRLNMAIPASVLKAPLEQYLQTNDAKVLEALASQDAVVHQTWDLHLIPRSKM
ncbi:peroxisomal leader peptide-processing protease-like isoform X2 [Leptopilina heterotoma]|nr:peroxisomal leader peptide-processing protease-like isoform X2 [Leptopilina heterotoma]XP_043464446.1 peroxisomal leader peptide-processing protease-like isoform X2 [Leptopilina heterotoma]XP_043464447.1 peroxisomal leader peptide-processing protease-like isoform X2 [Leptopilina heterotoma]